VPESASGRFQVFVATADALRMKHVADAKKFIDTGMSAQALEVLENLLGLAPKNHEALRLKAMILDAQGRFDESLLILRDLARFDGISDQTVRDLERRSFEEREVAVYSELTPEGRWYFAFPAMQLWISLYGFVGCAVFLVISPGMIGGDMASALPRIVASFFFLVALPWIILMAVHMIGIKKVLVGLTEIRICKRFSEVRIPWTLIDCAAMEHSADIRDEQLFLSLYGKATGDSKRPVLARFNVSPKRSVVRARRHFVRSILTHIDSIIYVTLEPSRDQGITETEVAAQTGGTDSKPSKASAESSSG
jgi:hypothetical protein